MSARPAPERPGDVMPGPLEFAGWPPGGALSVSLRIGPAVVRLDRLDAEVSEALRDLAGPSELRAAADAPADVVIEVSAAERPGYLERAAGERLRLLTWTEADALAMVTHHAALLLDAPAERGLLVLTRQDEAALGLSLQNSLRVIVATHLARRRRGLLLHAAALEVEGCAVLLVGPSGAGKTTALDLAAPWPALADDVALVEAPRHDGAAWLLHETALWAESSRRRAEAAGAVRPVGLALRLEKEAGARVEPLGRGSAVALLAAHAPFLIRQDQTDPALPALALQLASAVPAGRLCFARDAVLADPIKTALAAGRLGDGRSSDP